MSQNAAKATPTELDEQVLAHRRRVEEAEAEALFPLARLIEWAIFDGAATWETEFDARPGQVVSVSDAAMVAARFILRGRQ